MGRHTVPGTGQPTPDRGFWVRFAAVTVAVLLVAAYFLTRGDGQVTTDEPSAGSTPTTNTAPATPTSTSASPSASPTPTPSTRPATLSFVVLRNSYITVRVPGGRTLVSRLFTKGQKRSFDQKVLQVVNGRPSAVRFTVNGKPRKPGPAGEPETFTVRRR